jgi:hypothetical protein
MAISSWRGTSVHKGPTKSLILGSLDPKTCFGSLRTRYNVGRFVEDVRVGARMRSSLKYSTLGVRAF